MAQIDRRQGVYQQAAIKLPCRVATVTNITLEGLQTIDGVTLVADDRVLVTGQTDTTENGIYAADTGEWQRAEDFDGPRDVVQGTIIVITSGTLYGESVWRVTTASPSPGSAMAFELMGASALSVASAFMLTVLDDPDAATARTTLGAVGLTGNETVAGTKTFDDPVNFDDTVDIDGAVDISAAVTMSGNGVINERQGTTIPSVAGTTDIGAATGNYVVVSGTNTITGLGAIQAGTRRTVEFSGVLLLTHNGTSLILPGGANITTAAGDCAEFISEGSGNWRCVNYQRVASAGATTFMGADVALSNTANFFDGPNTGSLPPGSYLLTASAIVTDTAAAQFTAQIHNGSAALVSGAATINASGQAQTITLVYFVTIAAATTFTLQAKDISSTGGTLLRSIATASTANVGTSITWARMPP
jgi:hypothetical protein